MNEQLENYIRDNLAKGVTKDKIRDYLLSLGWKDSDIETSFNQLEQQKSGITRLLPNWCLKVVVVFVPLVLIIGGVWLFFTIKSNLSNGEPTTQTSLKGLEIPNLPMSTNEVAWTSDGKKAILLSVLGGEPQVASIGVADVEKATYKELYKIEGAYASNLSSDQNREQFLFFERTLKPNIERLKLLSLKTGNVTTIKEGDRMNHNNTKISPDAQYVLYEGGLRVMSIDGTDDRDFSSLIPASNFTVEWSPDSSSLLFLKRQQSPSDTTTSNEIAYTVERINIATKQTERILEIISPSSSDAPIFKLSPDGKRLLVVSTSIDIAGRHIWVYDLERNGQYFLSKNEGENMEKFAWSEGSSSVIAIRHNVVDGDRHIVVFPELDSTSAKILPMNDDFISIGDELPMAEGGIWLSKEGKELKALYLEIESLKNKFIADNINNLLDETDYLSNKNSAKEKQVTYNNKSTGLSFSYASRWGKIIEETPETYSCLRFSQLEGDSHIRVTTFKNIENYLNSQNYTDDSELYKALEEKGKDVEAGKAACSTGPVGFLFLASSISPELSLSLSEISEKLKQLATSGGNLNNTSLQDTAQSLASVFSVGLLGLEEQPTSVIKNNENSLIGLSFLSTEGFDTGSSSFLVSLYTITQQNGQIIVMKIPYMTSDVSSSQSHKFGHEHWTKIQERIKNILMQEMLLVEKSVNLAN